MLGLCIYIQLNPATAHFKGLVKIILYTKVFIIANIYLTVKMLRGTKLYVFLSGIC